MGRTPSAADIGDRRPAPTDPTYDDVVVWLFIAFIVLPVIEIWLITQVAGQLGWIPTLFLVVFVSAAGAWLVRREGLGVIQRVRDNVQSAKMPTDDLADGAMIFFASALMLTPGFLTDAIGLALLIPPIRAVLRPPLIAYFRKRIDLRVGGMGAMGGLGDFGRRPTGRRPARGDVFDVDESSVRGEGRTDSPGPTDGDDPPQLR